MTMPLTDQLAAARHALWDAGRRYPALVGLGRMTQGWALYQQSGLASVVETLEGLVAAEDDLDIRGVLDPALSMQEGA